MVILIILLHKAKIFYVIFDQNNLDFYYLFLIIIYLISKLNNSYNY